MSETIAVEKALESPVARQATRPSAPDHADDKALMEVREEEQAAPVPHTNGAGDGLPASIPQKQLSPDDYQLLKDQINPDLTDGELELFGRVCNRVQLDPFARQIFPVKRWDNAARKKRMSIQTSIDGFRLIAQRTGEYSGQLGPFWCGKDGDWKDVWLSNHPPEAAKVAVLRTGFPEPLWAVARFSAYAETKKDGSLNYMWRKMPDLMIAKCAEALALRRGFPQELSGLYTSDEMGQANNSKGDKNRTRRPAKSADPRKPKGLPTPKKEEKSDKQQHLEEMNQMLRKAAEVKERGDDASAYRIAHLTACEAAGWSRKELDHLDACYKLVLRGDTPERAIKYSQRVKDAESLHKYLGAQDIDDHSAFAGHALGMEGPVEHLRNLTASEIDQVREAAQSYDEQTVPGVSDGMGLDGGDYELDADEDMPPLMRG